MEGGIFGVLHAMQYLIISDELCARLRRIRHQLAQFFKQDNRGHNNITQNLTRINQHRLGFRPRSPSFPFSHKLKAASALNDIATSHWHYLDVTKISSFSRMIRHQMCWHCVPSCDNAICVELRRLSIALTQVTNDITKSNNHWKVGLFLHITFYMGMAVVCSYFAIYSESFMEVCLCVVCIACCWSLIAMVNLAGLITNTEINKIRQMVLRGQKQIDESHRFIAFKLYRIISDSDAGYSVLDFFQITRRTALILFGWFASAIVLMMTYFDQTDIRQSFLDIKVNDLVNNTTPKPLW
ncbi:hypothetical protein GZH46_02983 [Fragariocoptes setiger]|uniref:Gustatory receptor n=1 Tax=Fragariocoptes setiger TaxID=1670756 RepID=A0ABQ7S517_9ACAR|nr:hypothetical protein GZH46_02983 [Fragariocoptes setiger]